MHAGAALCFGFVHACTMRHCGCLCSPFPKAMMCILHHVQALADWEKPLKDQGNHVSLWDLLVRSTDAEGSREDILRDLLRDTDLWPAACSSARTTVPKRARSSQVGSEYDAEAADVLEGVAGRYTWPWATIHPCYPSCKCACNSPLAQLPIHATSVIKHLTEACAWFVLGRTVNQDFWWCQCRWQRL